MRSILFHHPLPLSAEPTSGSQVRPVRMLEAFRELGYEVEVVAGFAAERKSKVASVKDMISAGRTFDFAYAESSTMPLLLTEPHHIPTHPFLDTGFFRYLNRQSVPVGLFYRDAYWRFPNYKKRVPGPKGFVARMFYRYAWWRYGTLLDHLFLPTTKMLDVLPRWEGRATALPPGCEEHCVSEAAPPEGSLLSLFYVGGIQPPRYDLRPLLEAVKDVEGVRLTLCCRAEEWQATRSFYEEAFHPPSVRLVHAHGLELAAHYQAADVFVDVRKDHPYWRHTLPLKTFEPLGFGLPTIVGHRSEAARFVDQEGLGWVVSDPSEMRRLLERLQEHPEAVARKKEAVLRARKRHTWKARAEQAAGVLRSSSSCVASRQH